MFPNGLANSSGQVGRNYMRHVTGSVYAVFDKPVRMWRGTTMAGIVQDEARHDPARGFVGGYELETLALGLPFMAAFLDPGGWGREFTTALDSYENMAGMWIVGEDMPQETNRVTLDTEVKDQFGLPVAERELLGPPQRCRDAQPRLHAGHGDVRGGRGDPHLPDAALSLDPQPWHQPDVGRPAKMAWCNKWGQTHDIANLFISDGSQFTTGAAENPTLTIVALAIRQADHIAREMAANTI